jgi:hypothetical protein
MIVFLKVLDELIAKKVTWLNLTFPNCFIVIFNIYLITDPFRKASIVGSLFLA